MSTIKLFATVASITIGSLAATPAWAVKVGPVDDPLGVVKIAKGQPLVLGGMWVLSGPDTALGLDQKRAVEIMIDDNKGQLVGHPIRFITEDSQCSAEGGQTAATKLAANENLVVVIGPACSSAATPAAPILWKQGVSMIATSASAPKLTAPDRGPSYDGFVRTTPNDIGQAAGDANYMFKELGCKTAASIHDGSPYAQQLTKLFGENFRKLGGTITAEEAVSPTDVDMRPVLTRIATGKPCVVYLPIFLAATVQVMRQNSEVSGLDKTQFIAGSAIHTPDFLSAAGDKAVGVRYTSPDISADAFTKGYPDFVKKYQAKFGEKPVGGFHAFAFDGAKIAFEAIKKVAKSDSSGNTYIGKKALRDAIYATKNLPGLGGTLTCSQYGDCQEFKFALYQFTSPDPKSFDPGINPKKVFPAK
jgi:branched-chain amino acid transport system substrate-binding protein